jgi:hypothetical protein
LIVSRVSLEKKTRTPQGLQRTRFLFVPAFVAAEPPTPV